MNWGMIGHVWAVELLREHVRGGRLRHAYLFTGSVGIGRRTLALRLAQAVNCTDPPAPGEPCRACRPCLQFERMQHPDLSIVQTLPDKTQILAEQVRELQHSLSLHPYDAQFRVALILRAEEANLTAQNSLLKTLEEPPARVILVLTAENAELLLPTIVSRCEVLRLRPVEPEHAAAGLQALLANQPSTARAADSTVQTPARHQSVKGIELDEAQLSISLAAHIAGGRPGAALRLLQEPHLLETRQSVLNELLHLLQSSRTERFAYAEALSKEREKDRNAIQQTLLVWQSLWRDVLLAIGGAATPPANLDLKEQINTLAAALDLSTAHRALQAIERTQELLKGNVNSRLALEVLMLDLPRV